MERANPPNPPSPPSPPPPTRHAARADVNQEITDMAFAVLEKFQGVYAEVLGECPSQDDRQAYLDWHKRRVAVSVAAQALGEVSLCWCPKKQVREYVVGMGKTIYQTVAFLVGQGRSSLPEG